MNYLEEFRNSATATGLVERIRRQAAGLGGIVLMEVCGTHTMAISRFGIRQVLPGNLRLLSGPGCPVCVTGNDFIDKAVALARLPDVIVTTFGDMLRVPTGGTSLEKERAAGARVRVVMSPLDSVALAERNPDYRVVFLAIGFETTAPAVAVAVKEARRRRLRNHFLLCGHKLMPPALRALVEGGTAVDGFICPGHVSAIIGSQAYEFLAQEYRVGCVVAGFEPLDIMLAVSMLLEQIAAGAPAVENEYSRLVRPGGNPAGQALICEVFEPTDAAWRGIGTIPGSGLRLRDDLADCDAERAIEFTPEHAPQTPGCICGKILTGHKTPADCPLFATACTPQSPVGACMVSGEGSCAAAYRYAEYVND